MYFESKLNQLHHENMVNETKLMLESDKLEKLDSAHQRLSIKYVEVKTQNEELIQFKDKTEMKMLENDAVSAMTQNTSKIHLKRIEDTKAELAKTQKENFETKHALENTRVEYTSAFLNVKKLEIDVHAKKIFSKQIQNFYNESQD